MSCKNDYYRRSMELVEEAGCGDEEVMFHFVQGMDSELRAVVFAAGGDNMKTTTAVYERAVVHLSMPRAWQSGMDSRRGREPGRARKDFPLERTRR